MIIPDEKVEEVRQASDIAEVVGDYVRLKGRGSNLFGLCPFHNEKSPSFSVNPSMGIFKCFGCGAGGDVFHFITLIEHVGFTESVRMLAARAGITLPSGEHADEEEGGGSEPVYAALRVAGRFFYNSLTKSEAGQAGLAYFKKRGFSDETMRKYGLGFAPDSWDALLEHATEAHVAVEVLERAGLVIPRKDQSGFYDRYRGRAIFPIFSAIGKVIGFGGRVIASGDDGPKYINSPETEVYSKSKVLYGLFQGKQAIRKAQEVLLVEGYTDVISLHQAGVLNAVAACGTSLTESHVRLISRYAKRIIFINDADAAGDHATVRGISLALVGGLTPYVVELPDQEDPDSFVQRHGREKLEEFIERYRWSFVQFMLIRARQDGRLLRPEDEAEALQEVLGLIASIEDPLTRDAYVHEMSDLLDKPDGLLYSALEKVLKQRERQSDRRAYRERPQAALSERERDDAPAPTRRVEPLAERREALPEERLLVRVMAERGLPLVEFVLGNMGLDEFTPGPVRQTMDAFIGMYQEGRVDRAKLLDGSAGEEVQQFVAEVLMDEFEPSENWEKRGGITVPKYNEDPFDAVAGAMTLLKLDRVEEAIQETREQLFAAGNDADLQAEAQRELMHLYELRHSVERREFLQWNQQ